MAKPKKHDINAPLKYYPEPCTDNQRLFNLQKSYKEGTPESLTAMYELLKVTALKFINSRTDGDTRFRKLTTGEREEKAHAAATYIIVQYIERPDFRIEESFTGYLYLRVLEEVCKTTKMQKLIKKTINKLNEGTKWN